MTVYFMGGEIGTFTPADSDAGEVGSAAQLSYDGNFARTAVYVNGGSSSNFSAEFSCPDEFWFHAEIASGTTSATYRYYYFRTGSATDVLRLGFNNVGIKVDALISAVWTQVIAPTTVSMGASDAQIIDMHVTGNSGTGEIALYIAGVKRDEQVANLTAVTGIETIVISGTMYGGSQFIIADEPTVGWRLMTYVPTGAGATGDMTGDYTGIDERQNNDADFLNSGTANQVEIFTTTPVGSITGYVPRAVGVYCRARCGVGGPQNLQLALRSSGTTYFSGSKALDIGYASMGHIWNTDPATSAAFLASAIANLQPGAKSIT